MNVVDLKEYKKSLNKIEYTTSPKPGLNQYKKNLDEKKSPTLIRALNPFWLIPLWKNVFFLLKDVLLNSQL